MTETAATTPSGTAPNYGSATGHVEAHPTLAPLAGEITLGLEDRITCALPDSITGRAVARARTASHVLTRFADLMSPGLFDPSEPESMPFTSGYTVQRHTGVDVIWPTSAQEAVDPTVRFRGRTPEARAFLARLGTWCRNAVASGTAPMTGAADNA